MGGFPVMLFCTFQISFSKYILLLKLENIFKNNLCCKSCYLDYFLFQSWPAYEDIYKKMIEIAKFLDLPRFPDITEDCYLHPDILCMKYLMEVNLPGKCSICGEEAFTDL